MAFDFKSWLRQKLPGGHTTVTGWYRLCCPFHTDHSPSFAVHETNGNYGCKSSSCGAHGGLVRLVKEIENISWREAFALVEQPNPFSIDDDLIIQQLQVPKPVINPLPPFLVPVSDQRFPSYLHKREYDYQKVASFGLYFADAGPMRGHLIMPFWTLDGSYITYIARRMDDLPGRRYLFPDHSPAAKMLYGIWLFATVVAVQHIFVVEGQFDVMRMWSYGLPAVGLSTSNTTAAQRNQLHELHRVFQVPIWVMLDTGETEQKQAQEIAWTLNCMGTPAKVLDLPTGVKDPDKMTAVHIHEILDKCNTVV